MKKAISILGIFLITNVALAIAVDGFAELENQTDHSGIKVLFERMAPSSEIDSVFTNSSGYFSIILSNGVYNIAYTKDSYHSVYLINEVLYSDTSLSDVTLIDSPMILNVPTLVYPTIQSAIDESFSGDTVLVSPGTYFENINYNGKNITIGSLFITTQDTSYITQTIIDGNQSGSVVSFNSNEDSTAVLSGFTIKNGNYFQGAGIRIFDSSPSLNNLDIKENFAEVNGNASGGGIYVVLSNSTFSNTKIRNNYCRVNGGGLYCAIADIELLDCEIYGNSVSGYYNSRGGGIGIQSSNILMSNVIIENNSSIKGGGIYTLYDAIVTGENIIVQNNDAIKGGGIFFEDRPFDTHPNSIFFSNIEISNNSAEVGGGIFILNNCSLENLSIVYNSVTDFGSGIYLDMNSGFTLKNSIVSNNIGNYGIYLYNNSLYHNISYSNITNNEIGNFFNCDPWLGVNIITNTNGDDCDAWYNIDLNPLFVDYENSVYNLIESSPCIDAGDPTSTLDPDGTIADMGAYFYFQNTIIYPPVADFTADITEGYLPLSINFNDLSIQGSGIINQWNWDFGDTNNSSLQNPIHIYQNPGIYSVSLEVTDENDSTATEMKPNYITVTYCPPVAPDDVEVDIVFPDVNISWTAVDTTECGSVITPDGYVVIYSEDEVDYLFLNYTTELSYIHTFVAQFRPQMFYRIISFKDFTRAQISYLNNLNNSRERIKWIDVIQALSERCE
jgi:PKD repeat protein